MDIQITAKSFMFILVKNLHNHQEMVQIFDVVWNLLKKIQGKNHVVYFDNLFFSVVTAKFLYSKQFLMVGTVRSGRKYLPDKI